MARSQTHEENGGGVMMQIAISVLLLVSIGCTQHMDLVSPSGLAPGDLDAKAHTQTVSVSVWTPDPANPSQPFYLPNQPVAFQTSTGVLIDWTYGPRALASVQVPITDTSVVVVVNRQNFCSFSRAFALTGKRSTFSVELQQGCY